MPDYILLLWISSLITKMLHNKGEKILNSMERKVGHLALPQILRWIAIFQVLCWGLGRFSPGFSKMIFFNPGLIYQGEVWRLFSWIFFTGKTNLLFVLFMLFFTFFLNDALERQWGVFRLNVYVISTIFLMTLIGLTPLGWITFSVFPFTFFTAMFFAFATFFPNYVINLFGVIPIKAKWLALADIAILVGMITGSGSVFFILGLMTILGALIPYFLVFAPTFVQWAKATQRRQRFEAESRSGKEGAFHVCKTCGATDETHPEREFRVTADGNECCDKCREKPGNS